MSRVEYSFASLPLDRAKARYRDPERFIGFCRECERWNRCWACPPLTVDPEAYLRPYRWATFVAAKIYFDDTERAVANSPETLRVIAWNALKMEKTRLFDALLRCEALVPNSAQLSSGGCHLCEVCARIDEKPCRHPEKLRYSLDAFGFDLTKISEDLLGIRLLWSNGQELPEYYTLVHALLSENEALREVRSTVSALFSPGS